MWPALGKCLYRVREKNHQYQYLSVYQKRFAVIFDEICARYSKRICPLYTETLYENILINAGLQIISLAVVYRLIKQNALAKFDIFSSLKETLQRAINPVRDFHI